MKALCPVVLEKKIFYLIFRKSMGANDPRGTANLDPRGMIYVENHLTLLLTKYTSSSSSGFRKEDFYMLFQL